MGLDAAIGLLQQESGKALDPRVVNTFIELYPQLAAEAEQSQEPARKLTRVPSHAPSAAPLSAWCRIPVKPTSSRTSRSPRANLRALRDRPGDGQQSGVSDTWR
jgi:hypothetical protein